MPIIIARLGTGMCQLRLLRYFLLVCLPVLLQACASFGSHELTVREGLLQGKSELALQMIEKKDPEQKEVIPSLNKGMLRRINGEYAGSNKIFEVAKKEIDALYGVSITENLAAITINETLRGYEGDHYERLLLHAYMAMNYIQQNDPDDARVEMLQADVKVQEWGGDTEADAFVRYLAGLVYEALNEPDEALVSYRKSYKIYQNRHALYPEIPFNLQKDLLRMTARLHLWNEYKRYKKSFGLKDYHPPGKDKTSGDLVVILNNGLAPERGEIIIPIYSDDIQKKVRIAFPSYKVPKQPLMLARISIDKKQATLETVEDIDTQARHALAANMPAIMARATVRAVLKYNSQLEAKKQGDLAGLLVSIANYATEHADTRSWSTLPEEIQLQRLQLPAGKYQLKIEMLNTAGYTVDSMVNEVEIKPGRLTFAIHHWIAPVVKIAKTGDTVESNSIENKTDKSQAKEANSEPEEKNKASTLFGFF